MKNYEDTTMYGLDVLGRKKRISEAILVSGLVNMVEPYIESSVVETPNGKKNEIFLRNGIKLETTMKLISKEELNFNEIYLSSMPFEISDDYTGHSFHPDYLNHVTLFVAAKKGNDVLAEVYLEKQTERYIDESSTIEDKKDFMLDLLTNKRRRIIRTSSDDKSINISDEDRTNLMDLKNNLSRWFDTQVREEKLNKPNVLKK